MSVPSIKMYEESQLFLIELQDYFGKTCVNYQRIIEEKHEILKIDILTLDWTCVFKKKCLS